jgi:hypothetical protein
MPAFCNSSITCKIKNNQRLYYIGLPHSYDCNNINDNNTTQTNQIKNNIKEHKKEFINKLKDYIKNNIGSNLSIKTFQSYCLNTFYLYRYNISFAIDPVWIHNHYYEILNDLFPQDWSLIKEKNLINIENENIIKYIEIYEDLSELDHKINKYKYIIYGYNLLIRRAKLSEHWAIDATFNFTKGFE